LEAVELVVHLVVPVLVQREAHQVDPVS
jgi:hypothetical protein